MNGSEGVPLDERFIQSLDVPGSHNTSGVAPRFDGLAVALDSVAQPAAVPVPDMMDFKGNLLL